MSGYWQFMPVDNCGIIFADKNEFILNERQTRRITNASNYSKWHGKTVDINHPDEIKPEITRYSHQTTIFGAKFVKAICSFESYLQKVEQIDHRNQIIFFTDWLYQPLKEQMLEFEQKNSKIIPVRIGDFGELCIGPEISDKSKHSWQCVLRHLNQAFIARKFLLDLYGKIPAFMPLIDNEQLKQALTNLVKYLSNPKAHKLIKHGILSINLNRQIRLHRLWKCKHNEFSSTMQYDISDNFPRFYRHMLSEIVGPIFAFEYARHPVAKNYWYAKSTSADCNSWNDLESLSKSFEFRGGGSISKSLAQAIKLSFFESIERNCAVSDLNTQKPAILSTDTEQNIISWDKLQPLTNWQKKHIGLKLPASAHKFTLPDQNDKRLWKFFEYNTNNTYYIPYKYVFFDKDHDSFSHAHSEGLAAGETIDHAIEKGLLELIERDAVGLWWHRGTRRPSAIKQAYYTDTVKTTMKRLASFGRRLWLLDITTDISVPVVAAICFDNKGKNIIIGAAANYDICKAADKAVIEVVQSMGLFYCRESEKSVEILQWQNMASLKKCPWLIPYKHAKSDAMAQVDSIDKLLKRIRDLKMLLLSTDLSNNIFSTKVVRVIVPGLCNQRPVWGFERLLSVAQRMSWDTSKDIDNDKNCLQLYW